MRNKRYRLAKLNQDIQRMEFQKHKSVGEEVNFMMTRFSAYREQILYAYQTNDEFRALCEDFYSSALILDNFRKIILRDKKSELGYRKLFLVLENEILDFLGAGDNA